MLRRFAMDTYTETDSYSRYVRGAAICSDGKVRALRFHSGLADTFFSVPCSVQVKGKTISGYATFETLEGYSVDTESDPVAVKFLRYDYGRNSEILPKGAWKKEEGALPIAN